MKKKTIQRLFILIGFTLFSYSCSYRVKSITDINGEKHHYREYKQQHDEEVYEEKNLFSGNYLTKTYTRFNGVISPMTIDSVHYVQFDIVRVCLGKEASKYIDIFSSGILNSQIIYCSRDSLCQPPKPVLKKEEITGKIVKPHIGSWYGDIINIGLIEEPKHLKKSPQIRRFKLWINATYGLYGYDVYFIELRNETVDKYIDIKEFIKNARLTYINSYGSII